ncbi:MAG: 4-hydroxyphenylpyruvate dioxygenase [candidate division Zixibacteria bacterium]|nr:4-hydroxyphenylpyruvate dioxygenase [candidate division Zixibacteria bacterium]
MANKLGISGYDYVEFYVGSAKMHAYWFAKALGMTMTAYMGPETGIRDRVSFYMTKGDLKIVVTSAASPNNFEVSSFVVRHGDGVKRWSMAVEDVEKAYLFARQNGGVFSRTPHEIRDENGFIIEAAMSVYDDSELVFVNSDNYRGIFKPGYKEPIHNYHISCESTGLLSFDHVVGNVRVNEMDKWAKYFNQTMDFETFLSYGPGDISTKYSALLSKVVRSKDGVIKNPINEPFEGVRKSQIEEYIEHYHGTGIQHIAISTDDIIDSIGALRENGVEFLKVPANYYGELRKKGAKVKEDIDALERMGILCDTSGTGYLLQLFTKPIGDRPTFFFEIIQRVNGADGFGQGNFQALFEAIERDQFLRESMVNKASEITTQKVTHGVGI